MPSGIRTYNDAGQILFDIDTITSRVLGSMSVSSPTPTGGNSQAVAVGLNKKLWVLYYVTGAARGKVVRNKPSANMFTYYLNTDAGSGNLVIFYGEC